MNRDTEDSAPAEFPPEQPEADAAEDDGATYGAEEEEEFEDLKAGEEVPKSDGEDEEMAGAEDTAGPLKPSSSKDEGDEESDAGSEDLEAESSGSEDEEIEEEEGEGDGDEDMEMADDGDAAPEASARKDQSINQAPQGEVMVH